MPSSQMCLAARTAGKGPLGHESQGSQQGGPASAPHLSTSSSNPICLKGLQGPAYLRAHFPKLLQEEVLALQELPHHGLSTGNVPILAVREDGVSTRWARGGNSCPSHPIRSQGSDTGVTASTRKCVSPGSDPAICCRGSFWTWSWRQPVTSLRLSAPFESQAAATDWV